MSQQIQELIDKIKAEGLEVSQQQSEVLTQEAQQKAQVIIEEARQKARHMIQEVEQDIRQKQEATTMALKHASRDMLLALRKEIEAVLHQVVACEVKDVLTPEVLTEIITQVITQQLEAAGDNKDLMVAVSTQNRECLESSVMAKLQKRLKDRIVFESDDNAAKGFTISFDQGKSCFDFSNDSLAQYLSRYLNAQVATLIQEVA